VIVDPTLPSVRLWWRLSTQDNTLLRSLENEQIVGLALEGPTLDIGGGQGFGYVDLLQLHGRLDSINLAAEVRPTIVADLNATLPIERDSYQSVICFNTFEHIYNETMLLSESLRVLRPGGQFVFTIPFLFKRHGNYGDFHRHTAEYWERALLDQGLRTQDFRITPLVWSPLSTALATFPWFRGGWRGRIAKLLVLGLGMVGRANHSGLAKQSAPADYALGFLIAGRKPE
jgi:SAM-dependent methyltransferase